MWWAAASLASGRGVSRESLAGLVCAKPGTLTARPRLVDRRFVPHTIGS
jgi:hypothetical protein